MICVVEAKSRSEDGKLNNFSPIKPYFWIIGVAGYFGNMDLVLWLHVPKHLLLPNLKGLVRLSNALTRVEERLLRNIECAPHHCHYHHPCQVQFEIMNSGLLQFGSLVMILLMNTPIRNSKLHGKTDKMPCFGYTLKI